MLPLTNLNNVVMVVGTVSTLAFFLFIPLGKHGPSLERKRSGSSESRNRNSSFSFMHAVSTVGRATIMVAFGSAYGYVVMARLSYLVSRLQFLFGTVIPLIPQ